MSRRRRIIWYSFLFLLAGGLLFWQWWTQPRVAGERLGTWLTRLHDPDAGARAGAAAAVGRLGIDHEDAWKELVRLSLHDPDESVRRAAIDALRRLCQTTPARPDAAILARKRNALQTLLDALHASDDAVRFNALAAIYEVAGLRDHGEAVRRVHEDEVDKEMRPALERGLSDALCRVVRNNAYGPEIRVSALSVLLQLRDIPDAAIPTLILALQDKSPEVRAAALQCGARLGKRTIPALRHALDQAPEQTRPFLREVLLALGEKPDR